MSSFSLPSRYQPQLMGANFFQRQINSIADALPGVIKKGLAATPTANPPANTGLPDVSEIDRPKSNTMLYVGGGVALALVLAAVLGKKRAPKAA